MSPKKAPSIGVKRQCTMNDGVRFSPSPAGEGEGRSLVVPSPPPPGRVLAGGLARRMGGGDKARITIGGVPILQGVLGCLTPQCARFVINANGAPARFADPRLPV